MAIGSKAAEAVFENSVRAEEAATAVDPCGRVAAKAGTRRLEHGCRRSSCSSNEPCSSSRTMRAADCRSNAIFIRDLLETPNENAAGLVEHLRFASGRDQLRDLVLQSLPINRNVFVQNHQLDGQPFRAPVGMRLDQLPNEFDSFPIGDAQEHERRVAGDAIGPERALAAAIVQQHTWRSHGARDRHKSSRQPAARKVGLPLRWR